MLKVSHSNNVQMSLPSIHTSYKRVHLQRFSSFAWSSTSDHYLLKFPLLVTSSSFNKNEILCKLWTGGSQPWPATPLHLTVCSVLFQNYMNWFATHLDFPPNSSDPMKTVSAASVSLATNTTVTWDLDKSYLVPPLQNRDDLVKSLSWGLEKDQMLDQHFCANYKTYFHISTT